MRLPLADKYAIINLGKEVNIVDNLGALEDSNGGNSSWSKVVGPVYSGASLARALKVDEFKIAELEAKGKLVSLETADEHLVFPAFQFTPEMTVIPGLLKVWAILKKGLVDDWTMASWILAPFTPEPEVTMLEKLSQKDGLKKVSWEAKDTVNRWLQ